MNKLSLVEKIYFLESKLGDRWNHNLLESFNFDSSNPIEVQNAGRKIAQHIGLPPLTFVVTYSSKESNVAGHINLDHSKEVFIEINNKLKYDYEAVLAILAHEICHKYLHITGLQLFPEIENEILTDIATIYTGLGKLSLNGCEKTSYSLNGNVNSYNTNKSVQKIGYIDIKQFAFTYSVVCSMRRISSDEQVKGLLPNAKNAIERVKADANKCFGTNYFYDEYASQIIKNFFEYEIVQESQKRVARLTKELRLCQEIILSATNLPIIEQSIRDFHVYIKNTYLSLSNLISQSCHNESHVFIKNLLAFERLNEFESSVVQRTSHIEKLLTPHKPFLADVTNQIEDGLNVGILFKFTCPNPECNNSMRIGKKS